MIAALTLLLVFQLVGEVIARALALPIPGPVIGMALLFLALLVRGGPGEELRQTSGQPAAAPVAAVRAGGHRGDRASTATASPPNGCRWRWRCSSAPSSRSR
jgi:hypothetical protein